MPPTTSVSLFQNSKPSPLPRPPCGGHSRDMRQHFSIVSNPTLDMPLFGPLGERPIDSVPENPKRLRQSRANPSSKKRVNSASISGNVETNLTEGCVPLSPQHETTFKRHSGKATSDGEKPPRKRNLSKPKDKEVNHNPLLSSTHETGISYCDPVSLHGVIEDTLDLTHYRTDISLEGLISRDFNARSNVVDNSFGLHVASIGRNLVSPPINTDSPHRQSSTCIFERNMDSKSPNFMLNLEFTPCVEDDGSNAKDKKLRHYGFDVACNKPQESSLIDSVPVIPPEEFWSMIQLNPNVPVDSSISQARTIRKDMATLDHKIGNISQLFPANSTQTSQHYDIKLDSFANCKMDHWIRIGSLNSDQMETKESNLHSEIDGEVTKTMQKDSNFDIDLNKQPPEADAEAEASMAFSSAILSSKREVVKIPSVVEMASERSNSDAKTSPYTCIKEVEYETVIGGKEQMIDKQGFLESARRVDLLEENETKRMHELNAISVSGTKKIGNSKSVKDGPSNNLHPSSIHMREGDQDGWNDIQYSPGTQAAANILCEMARSSTLFYNQKSEELGCLNSSGCTKLPPKVIRIVGPIEKDVKAYNIAPACHKDQSFKDSVDDVLIPSKANVSEPYWASTHSENAAKLSIDQISGKESSPLDGSTYRGIKKHRSKTYEMHERSNKMRKTSRVSMFPTTKEAKGCYEISKKVLPYE